MEMLDQMSIEVQNLPNNQRSSFNAKIRQYKTQVDDSKSRLNLILDDEDKRQLFGSRYSDNGDGEFGDSVHDQQRKQLLNNNSSLDRSSQRLKDSQRIALETEGIGGNILNDLRAQREQIEGSRSTLSTADSYVDKSIRTLKSMSRRLVANKFISYAIIGVLIVLIFLVLASKFW
ncbi:snare region anchored in the vesicle membrane C-terminus-domain-containing protein [Scheffersomyces coipomensis]|uniref:snare region anchored in the vesicle membrane C-terminus-domain-containing protein n=1 Tax=Scheffersomyces coipomensis TaxID=1788519 RepID=UPI00315D6EA8